MIVSIGLVALLLATFSHRREVRVLAVHLGGRRSLAEIVAALVSVFGLLVLLSAIFRA
jgi:hypothetical protein